MGRLTGLDPDALRGLGDRARDAAATCRELAAALATTGRAAVLDTAGPAELTRELDEELTLLGVLCDARAAAMESADAGGFAAEVAHALLWSSLTDGMGLGLDLTDPSVDGGASGVPMSPTVAAAVLADHLDAEGIDGLVFAVAELGPGADPRGFDPLLADPDLPAEVRTAVACFGAGTAAMVGAAYETGTFTLTAASLRGFVELNTALATIAPRWNELVRDGGERLDPAAIDRALAPDSPLTPAERDALALVVAGSGWTDADRIGASRWLTHQLATRQVFGDDPELAAAWIARADTDPARHVFAPTWNDVAGRDAWLGAAVHSTDDPAAQLELMASMAGLMIAVPPPEGVGPVAHVVLDMTSIVDPTPLADSLNAAVYLVEGDPISAAGSAAGALVPSGGSWAATAARAAFPMVLEHARVPRGSPTEAELRAALVTETRRRFGDDAADRLARQLTSAPEG